MPIPISKAKMNIGIPVSELGDRLEKLGVALREHYMGVKAQTNASIDFSTGRAISVMLEVVLFDNKIKEEENGKTV